MTGPSRLIALCAAAVLALAIALVAAPGASADVKPCSKVFKAKPQVKQAPGRPPFLIGDSVSGFALSPLSLAGFRVNAQGCRTFGRAVNVLVRERKRGRPMPKLVIIGSGTAGSVRAKQIRRAVKALRKGSRLALVTPRQMHTGRPAQGARVMRRAARKMKRVRVIDWARHSAGRDEWFYGDLVHPNDAGALAYADLLSRAAFGRPFVPPVLP